MLVPESYLIIPMQMKELQIQHRSDIPANFLRKFWIESGVAFESFLLRCQSHGWLFSIEVPEDEGNSHAMVDAIDEAVRDVDMKGGPKLPKPDGQLGQDRDRRWEFLSCKAIKRKVKELRGQSRHRCNADEKMLFIEIKSSGVMLAPVDYTVNTITKLFGFKNTIREDLDDPEKLVIIGLWALITQSLSPLMMLGYIQEPDSQAIAVPRSRIYTTETLMKIAATSCTPMGAMLIALYWG
jgi:hypothetical protein